jgi:redox-sensing transcriptional repressor
LKKQLDSFPNPGYTGCEIFHRRIMAGIPGPAKERLLQLMRLLEDHVAAGNTGSVTSAQAESLTGWPRDTIRKDISFLAGDIEGGAIGGSAGYEPELLIPLIKRALGLDRRRKFCVVGLGRLGSAYLNFTPPELAEFELAAGFDTNVNRVEILNSPAPLYPAYKLEDIVRRFAIEIALLCVPADAAQSAAEKCATAGIRGILNFAPVALRMRPEIAVRNMYVTDELRSLAVQMKSEQ